MHVLLYPFLLETYRALEVKDGWRDYEATLMASRIRHTLETYADDQDLRAVEEDIRDYWHSLQSYRKSTRTFTAVVQDTVINTFLTMIAPYTTGEVS